MAKTSVELPKASLEALAADTAADLRIQTPNGNVTVPHDTLATLVAQAEGDTITVVVESVETKALTTEQQKAVGDYPVFDISILSNGKAIASFGGKSITVSLPYTLKDGEKTGDVTVWYLNDKHELEKMACTYDQNTGLATFSTDHLSHYVVGCETAAVTPWANPFSDVKEGDWFYGAVQYTAQKELFNGTSATTFAPKANMTRAMLVTVLYRLEGKPAVTGANAFSDVKSGKWYSDAILWANDNKVVEGYGNGKFGTNDNVTREQMVTILYRYAQMKGYDVAKTADLAKYSDAGKISTWAGPAMQWAVAEELINGRTKTTLAPKGTANRAEVATVLMRFSENLAQ